MVMSGPRRRPRVLGFQPRTSNYRGRGRRTRTRTINPGLLIFSSSSSGSERSSSSSSGVGFFSPEPRTTEDEDEGRGRGRLSPDPWVSRPRVPGRSRQAKTGPQRVVASGPRRRPRVLGGLALNPELPRTRTKDEDEDDQRRTINSLEFLRYFLRLMLRRHEILAFLVIRRRGLAA